MAIHELISGLPDALRGGLYWLIFLNTLAVVFILHRAEARWILLVWATLCVVAIASAQGGFSPGWIGTAALIFWTPLLCWLVSRNPVRHAGEPWGLFLVLLFASNLIAACLAGANLWTRTVL